MPTIEDQARELMSAWVEHLGPSEEIRGRTWAAVRARAAAGELGPELEPELEPAASGPTGAVARLRLIVVGVGLATIIGGGVGLGLSQRDAGEPGPSAGARATVTPVEPAPELEPAAEPPPSIGTPSAAPPAAPTVVDAPEQPPPKSVAEPRPRARAAAAPEPPAVDTLELELRLLGAARMALKSGDTEAALAALDEHRARFPRGALRAERELSRITALCKADRLDEAEVAARSFARAHPNATETKRLQDTCIGDRL